MSRITRKKFHIPVIIKDQIAVDCLVDASGLSKQKIKQAMQKGCVWLERVNSDIGDENDVSAKRPQQAYIQRLRRAKKVLKMHEILHFYYDEAVLASETADAVLIHDFGDYSIWNKPSGMLSQGSKWGDHTTIYRWAEKYLKPERPAFIVHRLDRAANGLIILAHKKSVARQFSTLFEQRQIEKRYQVNIEGDFSKMISSMTDVLTIDADIDNKTAISHVMMLSYNSIENTSSLEVQIETGRKHQIRKHLSGVGFPVFGDRLYGSKNNLDDVVSLDQSIDLQLQAKFLAFTCPITLEKRSFTLDS